MHSSSEKAEMGGMYHMWYQRIQTCILEIHAWCLHTSGCNWSVIRSLPPYPVYFRSPTPFGQIGGVWRKDSAQNGGILSAFQLRPCLDYSYGPDYSSGAGVCRSEGDPRFHSTLHVTRELSADSPKAELARAEFKEL